GWAWFVDEQRWACGGFAKASNQVAELFAVLAVLRAVPNSVPITIRTDSMFAVNTLTVWLPGWRRPDGSLRKKDGAAPANLSLVLELDRAFTGRDVRMQWVKGHSGNMLNEVADRLCGAVSTALLNKQPAPSRGPGWVPLPAGYSQPNVNAMVAGTRPATTGPVSAPPVRRTAVRPAMRMTRPATGRATSTRPVARQSFVSWDDEGRTPLKVIQPDRHLLPEMCDSCRMPIHPLTFECGCSR
ncbi:RNase H family protein, partial [Tessaracoccus sp.]